MNRLSAVWTAYLSERGVSEDAILARGYREVHSGKDLGEEFAATYGFPQKAGGLLIPLHPLLGGEPAYQLRYPPGQEPVKKGAKGEKAQKFTTPPKKKQRPCLATSPLTRDLLRAGTQGIFIAEGVTRVDALASFGIPALGILGAFGWRGTNEVDGVTALSDWEEVAFKENKFIVALDGDVITNHNVASASRRLSAYIQSKGAARVQTLALPDNQGLDDWIASHKFGDARELMEALQPYLHDKAPAAATFPPPSTGGTGFEWGIPENPGGVVFYADHKGLWAALKHMGIEVCEDARTRSIDVRRTDYDSPSSAGWYDAFVGQRPPDGWVPLDDKLASRIRTHIASVFQTPKGARLHFQDTDWKMALRSLVADRRHNSVMEWLESLPAWDGEERLSGMLTDCLGAEDTPLNRAMSRIILIAAIRRTYSPGVKHDIVPVFISGGGEGKSTFCRELLPLDRQVGYGCWFSDSVDMAESTQKKVEAIGPALIVEFSELTGLRYSSYEQTKSFISRQQDRYRPPWWQMATDILRAWVAIGTANPNGGNVLPGDPDGVRRMVAIPVKPAGSAEVTGWVNQRRDQLWAEALAAHKSGEQHWLPRHLEKEQQAINLRYQRASESVTDVAVQLTEKYMAGNPIPLGTMMVEMELAESEGKAAVMKSVNGALAHALRLRGWTGPAKRTYGGKQRQCFLPPTGVVEARCENKSCNALLTLEDAMGGSLELVRLCKKCVDEGDGNGTGPGQPPVEEGTVGPGLMGDTLQVRLDALEESRQGLIAEKRHVEVIPLNQVMIGLKSFKDSNPDRLLRGTSLLLPDAEIVTLLESYMRANPLYPWASFDWSSLALAWRAEAERQMNEQLTAARPDVARGFNGILQRVLQKPMEGMV